MIDKLDGIGLLQMLYLTVLLFIPIKLKAAL